jgi:capsular polysaccharide biosynthesis protein
VVILARTVTAGDVYRALWRYKLFIVILTAACVVATWYATSQQTKTYEASTLVRIQQRVTDPSDAIESLQAGERLAETYAEIIDSGGLDSQVTAIVSSRVSREDASGVDLSGEPVQDVDLLWISARDEDAATATLVANALPRALRRFISSTGTLRDQVVTVKAATQPSSAVAPKLGLNIALALLLGVILNGALVLLYELFRDRLPEPEELAETLEYPVLATIPTLRLRKPKALDAVRGNTQSSLVAGHTSDSRREIDDRDREQRSER